MEPLYKLFYKIIVVFLHIKNLHEELNIHSIIQLHEILQHPNQFIKLKLIFLLL